jgi:hypothetical protein
MSVFALGDKSGDAGIVVHPNFLITFLQASLSTFITLY